MLKEVLMPKLSSTMDEGYVTEWFKNEGDAVKTGEPIFEVMTDKIAIEVESYDDGVLLKRYVKEGEVVPVNTVIAYIGQEGDVAPETVDKGKASQEPEAIQEETIEEKPIEFSTEKVRATPAARKLAIEKGLDIVKVYHDLKPEKRLHKKDVANYQATQSSVMTLPVQSVSDEIIPFKGMRKAIADGMSKSVSQAPQVTLNAKVNADKMMALRKQLNSKLEVKVSYTSLIAMATVKVLKKHPRMNAHVKADGIHVKGMINLGIANAVEDGLIVPVVHQANYLNLVELTHAINNVVDKAKNNRLVPDDLQGGTFTITSLGSTRVSDFSPILNLPEVGILGVGAIEKTVGFNEQNEVVPVHQMTLSLTFDHRAIDGYPAGLFLSDLVELLEHPELSILY